MQRAHAMNVTTPAGVEVLPLQESDSLEALEEAARDFVRDHDGVWISLDDNTWLEKHSKITINFFHRDDDA